MLETDRLILRGFQKDDFDLIYNIYSDPGILRYTPFDTMTMDQADQHLEKIIAEWDENPRFSYEMAVIQKGTGVGIGRSHILIDPETDTGMIGWMLLKPYWGMHYATEVTGELIRYCFEELSLHRVNAVCHPENIASWTVLEKCGMRREALLKEKCRYTKNGIVTWQDELEYAMLRSEYMTACPAEAVTRR